MPKNVVSFRFALGDNPYVSDIGLNYSLSNTFVAPPYLDDTAINAILAAVGATRTTEPAVCSDKGLFSPRKLQFTMASGNTMSVAISNRIDWTTSATSIRDTINTAAAATNQVACIKLFGEEFSNLNDELGVTFDATSVAPSHKAPASADKQNYVGGVISYSADIATTFGANVTQSIRSITEASDNTFAAQLGTTPTTCIGDLLNLQSCGNGKRNPRKHRRFELEFLTRLAPDDGDETPQKETIQLPVASSSAADILSCGQAAAALPGLVCIGYMGESYSRVHRVLP